MKSRVLSAIGEYKLDKGNMIGECIGYKSVPGLFNALTSDSKLTSYLHKPESK